MKKSGILSFCLVLLMITSMVFAGCKNGASSESPSSSDSSPVTPEVHVCESICPYCKKCKNTECSKDACTGKCECEPVTVTHTTGAMLGGTIWATATHKYVTNKPGPKIAIVGGIHGDEKAGWSAGLKLVDMFNENMYGICGEILLIPQANKIADNLSNRYPNSPSAKNGVATYNSVKYSDLNRSFPNGRATTATEATIAISNAIVEVVEAFEPDIIIDLHESLNSWIMQDQTTKSLGDTLIYENQPLFMDDMIYYYNKVYREKNEVQFSNNPTSTKGSFNYYFTYRYTDKVVFTIETTRGYSGGMDTVPLENRVRQQINILNALFDLVWKRVDTTGIL